MDDKVYLDYIDYYLPQNTVTVDDIFNDLKQVSRAVYDGIDKDEFKKLTKLNHINIFGGEDIVSIIGEMIEKMLRITGIDVSAISYLVCTPDPVMHYGTMSVIHYMHKKFNMKNAHILPIQQSCTTSLFAMGLAEKLLNNNEYMLVLCANDWSGLNNDKKLSHRFLNFTVMGDAIGMLLIGKKRHEGALRICDWSYSNYGLSSYDIGNSGDYNKAPVLNRLSMIKEGANFIRRSLERIHVNIHDLEKFIVSNVRYDVFYNSYSKLLGVTPDIFFLNNVGNGGHANDIDLIRNLKDYILQNKSSTTHKICLYTLDIEESMDMNYHLVVLQRE